MAKNEEISAAQEQMKIKPQIEQIIPDLLDGELRKAALGFVSFLREQKLAPRYGSFNSWKVSYKGECVCYVKMSNHMEKNIWHVAFRLEEFKGEFSEGFKEAIQNNMSPCRKCLKACPKGLNLTVFGKELACICRGWPIQFKNPDAETLVYIKELIEYRQMLIATNTLPPPFWWNSSAIKIN